MLIGSSFPHFKDSDGSPLDAGYIYFGVVNQNPETNPIQVYWDDALTQPAVQPIRTLNGFIVRDGNIANLYAGSTYSITVKNKVRILLYSSSDSSTFDSSSKLASDLASSSNGKGDALIALKQPVTGSVARTVHDKLAENISLKDFGAIGDGTANDTAAITLALSYMAATGNNVFVPPGIYLSDPFSINSQIYAGQAGLIGSDRERCVIKRRTTGATPFVTYGSSSGTVFQSGVGFENITIDGGINTNGDAFVGYDIVRSQFRNVRFTGGAVACHLYGGISLSFYTCLFDMATTGLRIEKFTSLAGGGWPNIIRIIGGEIVDNTVWGAYFDDGRVFTLENVEVEGNGTTLGAAQGGVYIGPNVGSEVSVNDTYSIGLIASGCWFEANKGAADVSLNNGINAIRDSNFFSTAAMVTNDVVINGGRYSLRNVNMSMSKTANVLENAGTVSGNIIESSDIPNLTYNQSKTSVYGNNKINTRNGVVPVIAGFSIPFEQTGITITAAGTTIAVTFPIPFATPPLVFGETNNGDSTTDIIKIVISSVTTTGFVARALKISNGSSAISSISSGFNWRAIGSL